MKGIILAGGSGTRLWPLTQAVSKQLLLVYDKPMIYYPLTTLMLAGIRDILVITTPQDQSQFQRLLGDGHQWGICLEYAVQHEPRGLADAFIVGRSFVGNDCCALILGDNLFYGHTLTETLRRTASRKSGATIFAYQVSDPERYGVVEFDGEGRPQALQEKPPRPKTNWAVTGIYFYDNRVVDLAAELKPSPRGELEITDLNRCYLEWNALHVERLGRGYTWLDAGTHESLLQAAAFIATIEQRQGLKIACPEEIAYRMGYVSLTEFEKHAELLRPSAYGEYLLHLIHELAADADAIRS